MGLCNSETSSGELMVSASPQCQPEVKRQRTDKVNPMLLLVIKQISVMTEEDVRQTAIDQHAELLALRSQVAGRIRLIAAGIQPNPKSEVQISKNLSYAPHFCAPTGMSGLST